MPDSLIIKGISPQRKTATAPESRHHISFNRCRHIGILIVNYALNSLDIGIINPHLHGQYTLTGRWYELFRIQSGYFKFAQIEI